jgi:hypothetical protein
MKGRFKWVWLFIGVVVISASCGFGYEAKRARTQFEEARDAFSKRDWDRVAANLSDPSNPNAPSEKALASFLRIYLDPELATGKYELKAHEYDSALVPVKNMTVSYEPIDGLSRPVASLQYYDDAVWFDIPFSKKKWGIFRGKRIAVPFYVVFFRIAHDRFPQTERQSGWKSVIQFARAEGDRMSAIGITPKNLFSNAKTWEDYATEREGFAKKWLRDHSICWIPTRMDRCTYLVGDNAGRKS